MFACLVLWKSNVREGEKALHRAALLLVGRPTKQDKDPGSVRHAEEARPGNIRPVVRGEASDSGAATTQERRVRQRGEVASIGSAAQEQEPAGPRGC